MTFEGFLRFGGTEIVNNERVRGITRTIDCPSSWIQGPSCEGLREALDDEEYTHANIPFAPWYDASIPDLSGRFLGLFGLSMEGVDASTRSATLTEGIQDGGTLSRTRKGARGVRVRSTLIAQGRDALDYGVAWLNAALDADRCGQHGGGCGTTDMEFFTDCPPARGTVTDYTEWEVDATNLFPNPAFSRVQPGATVMRTNYFRDPRFSSQVNWGAPYTGNEVTLGDGFIDVQIITSGTTSNFITPATIFTDLTSGAVSASYLVENAGPVARDFRIAIWNGSAYAYGDLMTVEPGEQRRIFSDNVPVPPGSPYMQPRLHAYTQPGDHIIVREPIVEAAAAVGPYFDGTTVDDSGFAYGWSGTADASPSQAKSAAIEVRRNYVTNPTMQTWDGWSVIPATGTGQPGGIVDIADTAPMNSLLPYSSVPLPATPGDVFSAGMEIAVPPGRPAVTLRVALVPYGAAGSLTPLAYGEIITIEPGQQRRAVVQNAIMPAETTGVRVIPYLMEGPEAGRRLVFRNAIAEKVATVGPYFDGGFTSDSDLTPAWSGAANASASALYGAALSRVRGDLYRGARGFQSSRWAASGIRSLRITPWGTGGGGNAAVRLDGVSLEAGKTYTLIAKVHLDAPLTGTDESLSRRIRSGSASAGFVTSDAAPNVAGDHEIRWTLTPTVTHDTIQFWHGGSVGSPDIWWDDLLIIEGAYSGAYFDGETVPTKPNLVRYVWAGAVADSASTREVREEIIRPRTDTEYAKILDPFRRFMHDVAVTSGPIPIAHLKSRSTEGIYGVTMEWTITSERAWIYAKTRQVELPTTPSLVMQDTPFNLAPYPSAELSSGTAVVATNYSLNPSLEANVTGWNYTAATISGDSITGLTEGGRVVNELQSVGTASYRARLLVQSGPASGRARLQVYQDVDISARPAGSRVSATVWAALMIVGGSSSNVLRKLAARVIWRNGSTVISEVLLGEVTSGSFGGRPFAMQSLLPPSGTTNVRVVIDGEFDWVAASDIRMYADALAVTVP